MGVRQLVSSRAGRWGAHWRQWAAVGLLLGMAAATSGADSESANMRKHVIGATATIKLVETGLTFPARVDTGAESCSLHVEKIVIEDKSPSRLDNIGKKVRFLVERDGERKWIESTIAKAVRIKTAALKSGTFDRRYKVRMTLEWNGFQKEVLVTLNNRTEMEYPLLIGRNFLRGDFLVDVEKQDE